MDGEGSRRTSRGAHGDTLSQLSEPTRKQSGAARQWRAALSWSESGVPTHDFPTRLDVPLLRAVHTCGHPLPQFIEVLLTAQVLRRVVTELETFATQAEAEMRALQRRRQPAEQQALPLGTQDPG